MRDLLHILKEEFSELGTELWNKFLGKEDEVYSAEWGKNRDYMSPNGKGVSITGNQYQKSTNAPQKLYVE